MHNRSPGSSRASNVRSSMNSPRTKPKKLVTRQTTKTTNSHSERISETQVIKTSYENTTSQITQQFKNRPNLLKKITKINTINEIKETMSEYQSDPVHKYVKTVEKTETIRENKDGKRKIERKQKQNQYEEVLSDDDSDDQRLENQSRSKFQIREYPQSNNNSKISDKPQSHKESKIDFQGQSTTYQKGSASAVSPRNQTSIPLQYQNMIKKYMSGQGQNDNILDSIPKQEKIDFIKKVMNDAEFKERNIIKMPNFSSQTESQLEN